MPHIQVTHQRRRAAYGEWTRAILELLAAHGALSLAMLLGSRRAAARTPTILQRAYPEVIRQTLRRLAKIELIAMAERNGETIVTITKRGSHRLLRANLDGLALRRPKRWDRRWRVVIFDIPEEHRIARHIFQRKLRSLQFAHIQRSVYVTPYPCTDELTLLCEVYEVRPYVHCFEVPSLGPVLDRQFRAQFRLP